MTATASPIPSRTPAAPPLRSASGGSGLAYQPALDGLRGLAVLAVIAFHLGHLRGGFLGVDLFFTLSGYLITTLLLAERERDERIDLLAFWVRRARRLLPALGLLLAATAVYAGTWARPDELEGIRGPGIAALAYVTNWWFIGNGEGYWDLFTAPSPLEHLWSLAIEEQFYVVWPLVVVLVLRTRRPLRTLAVVAGALAVASTLLMAVLAAADDLAGAYLGTGSRVGSILVGAGAAVVLRRRSVPAPIGRALGPLALVSLVLLAWAWATVDGSADLGLYRGGFLLHALAVTVVIVAVTTQPGGRPARWIGCLPLRSVGKVSYGAYLWHWPVFVVLDGERTGLDGVPLLLARLACTAGLTLVSYFLVEQPIRHGALAGRRGAVVALAAPVVLAVALVVSTVPPAQTVAGPAPAPAPADDATDPASEPSTAVTTPGDASDPVADAPAGAPTPDDGPIPPGGVEASPAVGAVPVTGTSDVLRVTAAGDLPQLGPVSPADPLDVLLVGDSYMYDASPGMAAALEATDAARVEQSGMYGFTITSRGGLRTLQELVAEHRPDLVVAMWAAWDAEWLRSHDADEYRALLDRAVRELTSEGAVLAMVGFPPSMTTGIDPEPVDRTINTYFAELPDRFPGDVMYVDPDPVVAPSGEATRWLETETGRLLVRKTDLGHFCGDGSARFGLAVGELVGLLTGRAPAEPSRWWADDWRDDPRFDQPQGACST